jgi:hypothetical protein
MTRARIVVGKLRKYVALIVINPFIDASSRFSRMFRFGTFWVSSYFPGFPTPPIEGGESGRGAEREANQSRHNQSPLISKYRLSINPAMASLARDFRCFASVGIR